MPRLARSGELLAAALPLRRARAARRPRGWRGSHSHRSRVCRPVRQRLPGGTGVVWALVAAPRGSPRSERGGNEIGQEGTVAGAGGAGAGGAAGQDQGKRGAIRKKATRLQVAAPEVFTRSSCLQLPAPRKGNKGV